MKELENIFVNFHELRTVYFFKVSLCRHSTVNVMLPCCHATIVVDLAMSLNFLYNRIILCKECNKCDVGLPVELHSKKKTCKPCNHLLQANIRMHISFICLIKYSH